MPNIKILGLSMNYDAVSQRTLQRTYYSFNFVEDLEKKIFGFLFWGLCGKGDQSAAFFSAFLSVSKAHEISSSCHSKWKIINGKPSV